jgi:3-hydroxyacyl-[acyl-carrier-protein] dehydratase
VNRRPNDKTLLRLGPDVIKHLIPHRRPLLLVDAVERYEREPRPTLSAIRLISANEPIFEGHFPGLHLWPGIYTIEGLGQTSSILQTILFLEERARAQGDDPERVLQALRNLELGYRLHPGFRPDDSAVLVQLREGGPPLGLSGSVEMRFLEPVYAGQCLEYIVTRAHSLDNIVRFEVEARVESRPVARGVMTGVVGPTLAVDGPPR